jgi:hypothetical protein
MSDDPRRARRILDAAPHIIVRPLVRTKPVVPWSVMAEKLRTPKPEERATGGHHAP